MSRMHYTAIKSYHSFSRVVACLKEMVAVCIRMYCCCADTRTAIVFCAHVLPYCALPRRGPGYSGDRPNVEKGGRGSGFVRRDLGQSVLGDAAEPEGEVRGGPQEGDQEATGEIILRVHKPVAPVV